MCNRITMLARQNAWRYVVCCEHDVTHVMWDNVSVRLPTGKFHAQVTAFGRAVAGAMQFRIAGTSDICIIWDQHDRFLVWFGGAGFYLGSADFRIFKELIEEAARHPMIEASVTDESVPALDGELAAGLHVTPHLFSMN